MGMFKDKIRAGALTGALAVLGGCDSEHIKHHEERIAAAPDTEGKVGYLVHLLQHAATMKKYYNIGHEKSNDYQQEQYEKAKAELITVYKRQSAQVSDAFLGAMEKEKLKQPEPIVESTPESKGYNKEQERYQEYMRETIVDLEKDLQVVRQR